MGTETNRWVRFLTGSPAVVGNYKPGDEVRLPDWMAYKMQSHGKAIVIDGPTTSDAEIATIQPSARICAAEGCHEDD